MLVMWLGKERDMHVVLQADLSSVEIGNMDGTRVKIKPPVCIQDGCLNT